MYLLSLSELHCLLLRFYEYFEDSVLGSQVLSHDDANLYELFKFVKSQIDFQNHQKYLSFDGLRNH